MKMHVTDLFQKVQQKKYLHSSFSSLFNVYSAFLHNILLRPIINHNPIKSFQVTVKFNTHAKFCHKLELMIKTHHSLTKMLVTVGIIFWREFQSSMALFVVMLIMHILQKTLVMENICMCQLPLMISLFLVCHTKPLMICLSI